MNPRTFLTAEWSYLAMLNFTADPAVLKPFVPAGTELDFFGNDTFISVVGFRFLETRVLGWGFPFHRNFEEVNLRFYVRRQSAEGWRRGVVFVREIVPRRAIAVIARIFYGEPYVAFPTRHTIDSTPSSLHVQYSWRRQGHWESLRVNAAGGPQSIVEGSHEEFITEHYWGYTKVGTGCREYQVEHPRWLYWRASDGALEADVRSLYGERFAESLSVRPVSAFIAEGSPVTVRFNARL